MFSPIHSSLEISDYCGPGQGFHNFLDILAFERCAVSFPMRVSSRYTQHIVVVTCVQYTHFIIVVTCGSWVCRFQSGGLLWTPIGIALGGADSFFFHICMCQIILCFILHVIELFCLAGPICHRTRKLKIRQQVPLDSPLYTHLSSFPLCTGICLHLISGFLQAPSVSYVAGPHFKPFIGKQSYTKETAGNVRG